MSAGVQVHELVFALPATLDRAAARTLARVAQERRLQVLIVDFTRVSYIDSDGVLGLVGAARSAPECRVVLAGLSAYATTIAHLTYLHDVFDIYANVETALASMMDPPGEGVACSARKATTA